MTSMNPGRKAVLIRSQMDRLEDRLLDDSRRRSEMEELEIQHELEILDSELAKCEHAAAFEGLFAHLGEPEDVAYAEEAYERVCS